MPIPNNITFTPFDQLPASSLNDMIENDTALAAGTAIDNLTWSTTSVANPYKFNVYRNSAASTGSGVFAKLTFDTEDFDTNNNFATGTYTAPVTGFYHIDAGIEISTTAAYLILALYKNGAIYNTLGQAQVSSGAAAFSLVGGNTISLTAGDTLEIYTTANGAATLRVGTAPRACFFSGFLVSKT